MLSGVRLAAVSFLCFALPILCALSLGPRLFTYTQSLASLSSSDSSVDENGLHAVPDDPSSLEPMSVNRLVASDPQLDPLHDRYFIASVTVNISSLPRVGKRQKLVGKYGGTGSKANPGWAIALRRLSTSTRPEVYWQGANGGGGWFTFERFRFRRNRWYALTLVARPGEFMSLYVQEINGGAASAPAVESEDDGEEIDASEPLFLGGYALADLDEVATSAPLEFAPRQVEAGDFRGAVRSVLIANPARLPRARDRLIELFSGGPDRLASQVAEDELALWVQDDGLDHSRRARAIRSEQETLSRP